MWFETIFFACCVRCFPPAVHLLHMFGRSRSCRLLNFSRLSSFGCSTKDLYGYRSSELSEIGQPHSPGSYHLEATPTYNLVGCNVLHSETLMSCFALCVSDEAIGILRCNGTRLLRTEHTVAKKASLNVSVSRWINPHSPPIPGLEVELPKKPFLTHHAGNAASTPQAAHMTPSVVDRIRVPASVVDHSVWVICA